MTDVNVIALCLCAQLSMKSMLAVRIFSQSLMKYAIRNSLVSIKQNGIDDGQIIFLNSLCGHRVPPGLPAARFYSATKFMVTALTEGWRQEVRKKHEKYRDNVYIESRLAHRPATKATTTSAWPPSAPDWPPPNSTPPCSAETRRKWRISTRAWAASSGQRTLPTT